MAVDDIFVAKRSLDLAKARKCSCENFARQYQGCGCGKEHSVRRLTERLFEIIDKEAAKGHDDSTVQPEDAYKVTVGGKVNG
jgi:hypothetical protein